MTDLFVGRLEGNEFLIERQVRWGECDPAGIVYTPNFLDYAVDTGRLFWRAIARREFSSENGCGLNLPVKQLSSVFHSPLATDDRFRMRAGIVRVGTSSFAVRVLGIHKDRPAFEAEITFVSVTTAPRRSVALPDEFRAVLSRMMTAAA